MATFDPVRDFSIEVSSLVWHKFNVLSTLSLPQTLVSQPNFTSRVKITSKILNIKHNFVHPKLRKNEKVMVRLITFFPKSWFHQTIFSLN